MSNRNSKRVSNKNRSSKSALYWATRGLALLPAVGFVATQSASAGNFYWNTVPTGIWSDGVNWASDPSGTPTGAAPSGGDFAFFNSTGVNGDEIIQLSGPTAIAGLTFSNTGTTLIDSSSVTPQTLTIGTGGILINSGAGAVTIGNATNLSPIALSAPQTWTSNSANTFTAVNALNLSANALTINGTGATTISGLITGTTATGTTALSIGGSAVVTLANAGNTFTGDIAIDGGGVLVYTQGSATTASQLGRGSATNYKQILLTNGGTFRVTTTDYNVNAATSTNLSAGQVFNIGTGGGTFDVTAGRTFTLDDGSGAGTAFANTQLQGAGTLTKIGTGILSLGNSTASNAVFTGAIVISQGTLQLNGTGTQLGATSAGTTIASGADFNLNGVTVGAEPLTISGTGISGSNVVRNTSATNASLSGAVTLAGDSTIGSKAAGVLTLSGAMGGNFNLTVNNTSTGGTTLGANNIGGTITNSGAGTGVTTISGIIGTNVLGVVQNSASSNLVLSGANTFTTGVTIKAGSVTGSTSAAAFGTGQIILGDSATNLAATLIGNFGGTTANPILLAPGVTAPLTISSPNTGTLQVFSGGVTGFSNLQLSGTNVQGLAFATGAIDNTGSVTNVGTGTGNLTFSSNITSNVTNVVQNSATSMMQLSGTNSYSGSTTVTNGTLSFLTTSAMPNYATPPAVGVMTVASGGTLAFGMGAASGQFTGTDVSNVLNGTLPITFAATGASLGIDTTSAVGGTFTLGTTLTNPTAGPSAGVALGYNKVGIGTLVLTGTNTYTGTTTVSGGQLRATDGVALPTNSLLTLNGGVFETGVNFARTGGNAAGNVQLTGGTSGFSANGGNIQVAIGSIGAPTPLTWGTAPFAPTTLVLNDTTATNTLNFQNAVNFGTAARTVNVNANVATMSGQLTSGAGGGLTKGGAGTLIVNNATNSYAGPTTVTAGTLTMAGHSLPAASGVFLSGGTFQVLDDGVGIVAYGNTVNATTATTFAVGNNGGATNGSTLAFGVFNSPTTATNTGINTTFNGANGYGVSFTALNLPGGSGATTTITANANVIIAGNVANRMSGFASSNFDTLALTGTATGSQVNGVIADAPGTATTAGSLGVGGYTPVTKTGAGTWTLTGANTYSGATTVSAGTLALTGSAGGLKVIDNSAVNVNGGTLLINSNVIIGNGTATNANLRAASSISQGTVTVGSSSAGTLSMVDGSINTLTINGTAFTGSTNFLTLGGATTAATLNFEVGNSTTDSIMVVPSAISGSGKLSLAAGGAVINISALAGTSLVAGTYNLINFAAGGTFTGAFTLGSIPTINGLTFSLTNTGTAEQLVVSAGQINAFYTGATSGNLSATSGLTSANFVTTRGGGTLANVPGGSANVFFAADTAANFTTSFAQNLTFNSLNFTGTGTAAETNPFTIAGTGTLTLSAAAGFTDSQTVPVTYAAGTGLVVQPGAAAQTISAKVALGNSQTWRNDSSNLLTVSGAISGTGNLTLANNGTGATTISGAVGNVGTLTNAGTGTGLTTISGVIGTNVSGVIQNSATSNLTLTAANTFTGGLTIKAGSVTGSSSAAAFGTGPITLGDALVNLPATLIGNVGGTTTNPIILASGVTAPLTITSPNATTQQVFSGGITGTNSVRIGGTLAQGITFATGAINNVGTVTSVGSGAGATTISAPIGANVTGIVQGGTSAFNITSPYALSATNNNFSSTNTGTMTLSGAITGTQNVTLSTNAAGNIVISTGGINNTGLITNNGTGTGTSTISGLVGSNVTGIVQNGASPLTLTGVNTAFTGNVNVISGTLNANPATATNSMTTLGTGQVNLSGGTLSIKNNGVGAGGALIVTGNGTVGNNVSVGANSTINVQNNGANAGHGVVFNNLNVNGSALTVTGANSYNVNIAGTTTTTAGATLNPTTGTLNLLGVVNNGGNALTVSGAGSTRLFNAANAITGTINVNGGNLLGFASAAGAVTQGVNTIGAGTSISLSGTNPVLRLAPDFSGGLNATTTAGLLDKSYTTNSLTNTNFLGATSPVGAAGPVGAPGTVSPNLTGIQTTPNLNIPVVSAFPLNSTRQFTGLLNVTSAGMYLFNVTHDDGNQLYVDGNAAIGNIANTGSNLQAGIYLTAGLHTISDRLSNQTGNGGIVVSYAGPDTGNVLVALNGGTGAAANTLSYTADGSSLAATFANNIGIAAGTNATIQVASNTTLGSLSTTGVGTGTTLNIVGTNDMTTVNFTGGSLASDLAIVNATADLTLNGNISGAGGISKSGFGALNLAGANTFTGPVGLNGGLVTLTAAETAGVSGPLGVGGTISLGGSTLRYTATNNADYSSRFSSAAGQLYNIDTNGQNVTFATGLTSSTGALTKLGLGSLTLGGISTYTGNTVVTAGTLNITGSLTGNGTTTTGSLLTVGNTAGQNAVVNLSGSVNNYYSFSLGTNATAAGVLNMTGGVFTDTTTANNNTVNFVGQAGYGYLNLTGGNFNAKGRFAVSNGTGSTGVVYVGGSGVLDTTGGEWFLMAYSPNSANGGGLAEVTVGPGGQLLHAGASSNFGINMDRAGGYAVLNVAGGLVTTSNKNITFGNGTGAISNTTGMLNLSSGTLTLGLPILNGNTGGTGNNAYLNFAGGTIQTNAGVTAIIPASAGNQTFTSTIFGAIDNTLATGNTSQNFNGGLTFDTNGFNSSLTNPLLGASGFGVTQTDIALTGGTGYVGAPMVQFSVPSGGGTPAAGYALITGGQVTGIVITAPGTYASGEVPTITLTGGGASTAATAAINGAGLLTANANTGGLTKIGTGTLTLSGANTYGGATTINAGTVALGANNVLADTSAVNINNGSVFDINTRTNTVGAVTLTAGSITGTTGLLSASSYNVQGGTITANLGGSGGFTKSTASTFTFSGTNSFAGPVSVTGGTVLFSNSAHLGDAGSATNTINLSGASTLVYTGIGALDLGVNRVVTVAPSGGTLDIPVETATLTVPAITGAGGVFTKTGTGTLLVPGGISMPGGSTTITDGRVRAGFGTNGTSILAVGGAANLEFVNGIAETLTLGSTPGALSLSAGAKLGFELGATGVNDRLSLGAGGTAITGGTITLNFFDVGSGIGAGTFNLISASSGLSAANYVIGSAPSGFNYSLNVTDGLVSLTTSALVQRFWNGSQPLASWAAENGGLTNFASDSAGGTNAGLPSGAHTVIFSASSAPFTSGNSIDTTLDAAFTIDSLQFRSIPSGVTAVTIAPGSGGMLTLNPASPTNGIRVDADGGAIAISAPLTVAAPQTWSVDGTGTSSLAVSGDTTFTAKMTKAGNGALTLTGNNLGAGGVTLAAGRLNLGSATALGTGTLTISGGSLDNVTGGLLTITNPNAWNGSFSYAGTAQSLSLDGAPVVLGDDVTVTVAANQLTVGGAISGTGKGLTKDGLGQLILSGTSANTFDGPVVINSFGTGLGNTSNALVLAKTSGVNAIAGTSVTIGNNSGGLAAATLRLGASDQINDAAVIHFNGGTGADSKFEMNGFNETIAGLVVDSGNLAFVQNLEVGGTGTSILTIKSDTFNTNYAGAIRNQSGTVGLTKDGLAKVTLTGANITYTGPTTLKAGTLELGASAFASPITFSAGSTGLLQVLSATTSGGLYSDDANNPNNIVQNTAGISAKFTAGNAVDSVFGGIIRDNPAGGTMAFGKSGAGKLTLLNAGAFSGGVSSSGGTLISNADNGLGTGGMTIGDGSTNVGNIDLANFNQTVTSLSATTNSATAGVITVAPTKTLTVNGNVVIGQNANSTTKLQVTGGALVVNNAASGAVVQIGGSSGGGANNATLDLTGLGSFTASLNTTNGVVRVSNTTGTNVVGTQATLLLPTPVTGVTATTPVTTITASALNIGDGSGNNAGAGQTNTMTLGTGLTTLNVGSINVGTGGRDLGQLNYASGNGTLKVRGVDGASRVPLNIGTGGATTGVNAGAGVVNNVDLSGHSADLLLGAVAIGTQSRSATYANTLTFDTGTLDMTSLAAATRTGDITSSGGGAPRSTTVTVNLGGGTVNIQNGITQFGDLAGTYTASGQSATENATLNISGGNVSIGATSGNSITMARMSVGASSQATTVNAAINITGGTTTLAGNIVRGATTITGTGTATNTATVSLNGATATLDMGGKNIGTAALPINNVVLAAGTLKNIGDINGGAALVKTGPNQLAIEGTNAYPGATTVNEGTLRVNSSIASSSGVTVASGAKFATGSTQTVKSLALADGASAELASATLSVLTVGNNVNTTPFSMGGSASSVDMHKNVLIVDYPTGSSPIAAVHSAIVQNYNGGTWNGIGGIGSTEVTASTTTAPLLAVGYAEATSLIGGAGTINFGGLTPTSATVDATALVVRTTLSGDADLDGTVNLNDLIRLANNYGTSTGLNWSDGDFDYSGGVDLNDLIRLANNYGSIFAAGEVVPGASDSFNADLAAAFNGTAQPVGVPEPTTLSLAALGAAGMLMRRRRRA